MCLFSVYSTSPLEPQRPDKVLSWFQSLHTFYATQSLLNSRRCVTGQVAAGLQHTLNHCGNGSKPSAQRVTVVFWTQGCLLCSPPPTPCQLHHRWSSCRQVASRGPVMDDITVIGSPVGEKTSGFVLHQQNIHKQWSRLVLKKTALLFYLQRKIKDVMY